MEHNDNKHLHHHVSDNARKTTEGNCCCGKGETSADQANTWICPMHCEGDKTYDKAGNCPECNMKLVPAENAANEHHHHHTNHQHDKTESPASTGTYYCPMRCEGDKTYDKAGDCPECGMHLVKEISAAPSGTTYTCAMHPEIKRDKPGSCPICGMDLIPEAGDVESEEEKAYKKMAKKFRIALFLSVPVLFIAMSEYVPFIKLDELVPKKIWNWIEFLLATPVLFYSSWVFFKRGWSSIVRWTPNMWTLISIGVGAAYIFSVFALLLPEIFPPQFKDAQGNVHIYFEAVAVILTLVILGQVLELRAHSKTNSAIKALLGLVPPIARIVRNGTEEEIPLEM
ncbi:MAG: hypothetical protein L3J31_05405 [Bacteroidales bacterium]|nr:hypothetical protein [Bacteroidales bacterium]